MYFSVGRSLGGIPIGSGTSRMVHVAAGSITSGIVICVGGIDELLLLMR